MGKILSIIPYPFYPPRFGGALRCFYILKEMAKCHDVTLLTVQEVEDFSYGTEPVFPKGINVVSIAGQKGYRTPFNIFPGRIANAINSRILKRSLLERGNLFLLNTYPVLKQLLQTGQFDLVNYENLECFGVLYPYVKRLSPQSLHLYDAHNVDSELWLQLSKADNNPALLNYAAGALAVEKSLHKKMSLCFACSAVDKEKLEKLNQNNLKVAVVSNGVDTSEKSFDHNPNKHAIQNILFCGTLDYLPNTEGLLWFYEQVFPTLKVTWPDLTFTVIGKMNTPGPYEKLMADPSVRFIGPVESVQPFYRESSVFVVPLMSGSGTRLKVLEAMSMGNPVVSTHIGAEGILVENGKHIRLADEADAFAEGVTALLTKQEVFDTQRKHANKLVKELYDWTVIGRRLNQEIDIVVKEKKEKTCLAG